MLSSPAIGYDGTIYIGSRDNKLYAINPDGTERWSFLTGGLIDSSPAISSDETIYVGSNDWKLYAINPDGTEKWNFATNGSIESSPAIGFDGTIYVGSSDKKIYAVNPDGTEKWSFTTGKGISFSSAGIDPDGTIYIGSTDNKLYAIYPNGTEKWNFETGNYVNSSPAIGFDGTIYVTSLDRRLYAINHNGSEKWNFYTGGSVYSSPAIGFDGTIYVGSMTGKWFAINTNGTEKWNFTTGNHIFISSPAIGSDGTIYVVSKDNNLYAINPDGTEKWKFTTISDIEASPAIGSDGTIYVGSTDNKLYAIGNSPSNIQIDVSSHFTSLNSAAQSAITVHVTDGSNPVQGATVNLVSDNGGIFSLQSGITDANGDFKSIFNAPTVTSQIICRISAEASKIGYNNGSGYVDVTINPIPWPMFRQNLNHTGVSPYDTSSNPGKLKWNFTTDFAIISSPSIGSDGTVYIGSSDYNLYAINPDGTEKWRFVTGKQVQSTPAISVDGTIYVGSRDNNLYAINPDGTEKWRFTTGNYISSSPAIGSHGTIYVGSADSKLVAIWPNGSQKWSFSSESGGFKYNFQSSPAIGSDGTIYVGCTNSKVYAIYPDGTQKWNYSTGSHIIWSSPAIGPDGTIYIGTWNGKLCAINPDGTKKWDYATGKRVESSPAIGSDGTIYVGSRDNKLYAINPLGTKKWSFTTGGYIDSSPAIGSDGTIYFGSEDNNLYAISPSGIKKWNFSTGGWIKSSPSIGSDGTIYVGSIDHNLYAIGIPDIQSPIANAGPDQTVNEGDIVQFDASASYDPDGTIESYEWDFDASDGLWWETGATPDATGPTPTHIYGDDGIFVATFRVTDNDNLSATDICNITVLNIDPIVEIQSVTMNVEIGLRVAGRKYNEVEMNLYEDGVSVGNVSIERSPGSPNEQMVWIPITLDLTKTYSTIVTYIPKNPPEVGANPVWIYIKSENGSINRIHHTFNVQQSKKRDSEHWNHIEPWEVDLNPHLNGLPFEIISHITDPGSDDESLTYTYGSQIVTVEYLNNPPNPDQYPSPEVNPRDIIDTTTLIYEGPGTIAVIAKDDDNLRLGIGEGSDSIDLL